MVKYKGPHLVTSDVVVDVGTMLQKTVSYGKNVNLSLMLHKNEL
jgi:hypothetical protein